MVLIGGRVVVEVWTERKREQDNTIRKRAGYDSVLINVLGWHGVDSVCDGHDWKKESDFSEIK